MSKCLFAFIVQSYKTLDNYWKNAVETPLALPFSDGFYRIPDMSMEVIDDKATNIGSDEDKNSLVGFMRNELNDNCIDHDHRRCVG